MPSRSTRCTIFVDFSALHLHYYELLNLPTASHSLGALRATPPSIALMAPPLTMVVANLCYPYPWSAPCLALGLPKSSLRALSFSHAFEFFQILAFKYFQMLAFGHLHYRAVARLQMPAFQSLAFGQLQMPAHGHSLYQPSSASQCQSLEKRHRISDVSKIYLYPNLDSIHPNILTHKDFRAGVGFGWKKDRIEP
ncbi:hypothetical protein B0H19DRAFT_1183254 [Mycena capillaripes]|nr:hypothetical protein B0H19DRAFT_1183254 [Mycena capillaripes]